MEISYLADIIKLILSKFKMCWETFVSKLYVNMIIIRIFSSVGNTRFLYINVNVSFFVGELLEFLVLLGIQGFYKLT